MIRASIRIVMVAALIGIGWMAAKAQTSQPDFELIVNAPRGETTIECVRGCQLAWGERGLDTNSTALRTFTFACGGTSATAADARCSSYKVGGWIKR